VAFPAVIRPDAKLAVGVALGYFVLPALLKAFRR